MPPSEPDRSPRLPALAQDLERVLIDEDQLQRRVTELGAAIAADYAGRDLLVLFVLKGALLFVSDLVRAIDLPLRLDFMVVSSYGAGVASSGSVRIVTDMRTDARNHDILIVEDIIDTGLTLTEIIGHLAVRQPASIEICTLLSKPARRQVDLTVRYVGFEIPDAFVVGYGLDFAERYRNLPYIGVLKSEHYRGPA